MADTREQMGAQAIKSFGSARDVLQLVRLPIPDIALDEVLIKVDASSVNPVDCKIRSGLYPAMTPDFPAILHSDVAGTIAAKGNEVSKFDLGDRVYGCAGGFKGTQGAIAQYMLADSDLLAKQPVKLAPEESAALPLVAITAWQALIDRANLQPGNTVLIHAASGGVGSIALQIAKWRGAEVFTTASSDSKANFAKECGVATIDYHRYSVEEYLKKYTKNGAGFDVVFDTVGGANLQNAIQSCKTGGIVCAIAACNSIDLRPLHKKAGTLHYIFMPNAILNKYSKKERQHYGYILGEISKLVDQGSLKPLIGKVVNFSDLIEAHELLEQGKTIGKIVLKQNL